MMLSKTHTRATRTHTHTHTTHRPRSYYQKRPPLKTLPPSLHVTTAVHLRVCMCVVFYYVYIDLHSLDFDPKNLLRYRVLLCTPQILFARKVASRRGGGGGDTRKNSSIRYNTRGKRSTWLDDTTRKTQSLPKTKNTEART